MNTSTRTGRALSVILAGLLIAACGGGGGGSSTPDSGGNPPPTGGIDRGGVSFGAITAFGSVIVNGVRFDTSNAQFVVNGSVGSQDDLRVGQVVLVTGTVNDDDVTGEAERVEYDDEVKGPVEALDAAAGTFSVLGLQIQTDANTLYGGFADFAELATAVGQGTVIVEVSGFRDAQGRVRATRVDRELSDSGVELKGQVSNLNTGATTFSLGTQAVNYGQAQLPDGVPANGDFVEARGTLANGVLVASSVEREDELGEGLEDGARAEVEGFVSRVVDASRFELAGVTVVTSSSTVYEGGTAADVRVDVKLQAEGTYDPAARVLRATKIEFKLGGDYELAGTVQSVGSTGFRAVGVDVAVTLSTSYEDDRDDDQFFNLARLRTGDYVEVRGGPGAGDGLVATLVERKDADADSILQGPAQAIDANAGTFTLFGVTVDTSGVSADDFRNTAEQPIGRDAFFAALADGRLVKAKGQFDGTDTLAAREVQLED